MVDIPDKNTYDGRRNIMGPLYPMLCSSRSSNGVLFAGMVFIWSVRFCSSLIQGILQVHPEVASDDKPRGEGAGRPFDTDRSVQGNTPLRQKPVPLSDKFTLTFF